MATALQIVQSICKRIGIPSPNAALSSADPQIIQVVELCNEEGQELARRTPWTALQNEATYTTLAAEDQGSLAAIAPGLNFIINDTIWNRSLRRPVFGPKSPQSWQQNKAFAINGPWSNFRIKGNHLYMYPTPTAGESCYFEYVSKYWCTDSSGATGRYAWSADDDVSVLDDQIIVLGVVWRWKQMKGFEYSEDFNKYERAVMDAMARDGSKDWLSLTNTKYDVFPGVIVPAGSWNL